MSTEKKVIETAEKLSEQFGYTTTLDIKSDLRRSYPVEIWDQDTVSEIMRQAHRDGKFIVMPDEGLGYYKYVKSTAKPKGNSIVNFIKNLF